MRQQGILNKIIALFALLSLVLPASAGVASCMSSAISTACCMSQATPKVKKAPTKPAHDCCKAKEASEPTDPQLSEGKSACHCLRSFPTQLPNDQSIKVVPSVEDVPQVTPSAVLPTSEPASKPGQAIFYRDIPPPGELISSSHSGRAPPVSVQ